MTESPGNLRYPGGHNVASTRHVSLSVLRRKKSERSGRREQSDNILRSGTGSRSNHYFADNSFLGVLGLRQREHSVCSCANTRGVKPFNLKLRPDLNFSTCVQCYMLVFREDLATSKADACARRGSGPHRHFGAALQADAACGSGQDFFAPTLFLSLLAPSPRQATRSDRTSLP